MSDAGVSVSIAPGEPLRAATFVERPNRFIVHCRLEEEPAVRRDTGSGSPASAIVRAHLADPGRLRELLVPGRRLWLRAADRAGRATSWSAVLVQTPAGDGLVSVDTTLPNRLIARALERSALHELEGWALERAEVRIGRSRFDFLLAGDDGRRMALEVKSVTLVGDDGRALFPDAVTARGTRHLRELAEIARRDGWDAAVLFVAQRDDAASVEAAAAIDPAFAAALAEARAAGVRVLGRGCRVSLQHVRLGPPLPVL